MAWYGSGTGGLGNGACSGAVSGVGSAFGVVLLIPLRGCFKCPLEMDGLGIKYFCTVCELRCMALINKDTGGMHRFWCMNFTSFSLLVWWHKKVACSEGDCVVVLAYDDNTGVVNAVSGNIGRVHKLLFGSLYPVKITCFLYMT